jgi:hypothetical protein
MPRIQVGDTFGGYEIEAVIGRGGMGVVYRAEQPQLGRQVAIKVIAPEHAANPVFQERFRRESRLAASIEHPNAIPIYEAGVVEDETMYLVMRYVDGIDLSTLISRDGPLDPSRAARIVDGVAGALDEAHAAGLVHRDVKPGNVLIASSRGRERALLTDFGLTKLATEQSGVTATGNWVGTIDYASPEQIRGRRLDARSDVYALGCVMFCALTGRVPFERETDVAKLYAHANDQPPPPSALRPGIPPELDEAVMRALAKDPEDRYPSAGDFGRATTAGMTGAAIVAPERTVATGAAAPGSDEIVVPPTRDATPPASAPVEPAATEAVAPPAPPAAATPPETPTADVPPPEAPAPAEAAPPAASEPPGGETAVLKQPKKRRINPLLVLAAVAVLAVGGAFAFGLVGGSDESGGGGSDESGGGGAQGGGGDGGGAIEFKSESFGDFTAEVPADSGKPSVESPGPDLTGTRVTALDDNVGILFLNEPAGAPLERAQSTEQSQSEEPGYARLVPPQATDIAGSDGAEFSYSFDDDPEFGSADVYVFFPDVSDSEGRTYRVRVSTPADGGEPADVLEEIGRRAAESLEPS